MRDFIFRILAGLICVVSIHASAAPFFVDLKSAANTDIEDDGIAGNGKGGWSDEGINDMFIYPPVEFGKVNRYGYQFEIIDPKTNNGKSVIMLKGQPSAKDKPAEVDITIPDKKGKYIYFLQNLVGGVPKLEKNYQVATYTVEYSDGSKQEIPIREGIEIRKWWAGKWWDNSEKAAWPIFMGRNTYTEKWKMHIGVWAMQWENPEPQLAIKSIQLKSADKLIPVIWAITIADEDFFNPKERRQPAIHNPKTAPAGYFEAKLAQEQKAIFDAANGTDHFKGVRKVELINNDILAVTVDNAMGMIGSGPGEKIISGFQKPETFKITSMNDPDYKGGKNPAKVNRQSYEYWNGYIGPFPQVILYWHTFFLQLPSPLKSGSVYNIKVNGIIAPFKSDIELKYNEKETITPVIKVNQVSYSSKSKKRFAYLGWWDGDGGKVDFAKFADFKVIDEKNGKSVYSGKITLRKADDPLSGEDVFQMDISSLKSGQYHILIPGLGRSDSFGVGKDKVKDLYFHTMRAFFHQRAGNELKEPFTSFKRPPLHLEVYESGYLVGNKNYAPKPNEKTKKFTGGYYDAADYDCFTYHLRATAQMLAAFEQYPGAFQDKDLNIPESGNSVPDILDEADWALFSYRDLQQPDGGVPLGRGNDQDYIREWEGKHKSRPAFGIFPPTNASTTEYAAVAAQFSRLVKKYNPKLAEKYLQSAEKAYEWAKQNPTKDKPKDEEKLFLAWAASELFETTGKQEYNKDIKGYFEKGFLTKTSWRIGQFVSLCQWPYAASKQKTADKTIQKKLRDAITKRADGICKSTELAPYRMGRGPQGGTGWGSGNGGGHYADHCLRAYWLTEDQKYLDTASLNADFQLGTNPLSKTFISGMGSRPPNYPQISEYLYTGPNKTGKTVKGISIYGLAKLDNLNWYPKNPPAWRRWRDIGNGSAEICSEFTITETIGSAAILYGTLWALEKE